MLSGVRWGKVVEGLGVIDRCLDGERDLAVAAQYILL